MYPGRKRKIEHDTGTRDETILGSTLVSSKGFLMGWDVSKVVMEREKDRG